MKSMPVFLVASAVAVLAQASAAETRKPRVTVAAFENRSASGKCYRGGGWLGSGFQDQLLTALSKSPKVQIFERGRGRADFAITGSVTEFESCASGSDTNASVGGFLNKTLLRNSPGVDLNQLQVGVGKEEARVGVDLRVVDVETGEVVKSASAQGSKSATHVKFAADVYGVGFSHSEFKNTPLGEAARDAVESAARKILAALPEEVEDRRERPAADEDADENPRPHGRSDVGLPSDSEDAHPDRDGEDLDQEISEYKAAYCPDSFAGQGGEVGCAAVQLLKKWPETRRMEILNLSDGNRSKVPYGTLDRLVKVASAELKVGDYVLLSDMYGDRSTKENQFGFYKDHPEFKAKLHRCSVTRIVRSERFVQTTCGGYKEVPFSVVLNSRKPVIFFTSTKLKKKSDGDD